MTRPRILVAGVGNIFLGDDGFGPEAARRLLERPWPEEVRVVDFGVRGIDLAYALTDGYETAILLDATPQGGQPGALYLLEPNLDELAPASPHGVRLDPHRMDLMQVLREIKVQGAPRPRLLLVGCEPADLGGEEGRLGLSAPVQAALGQAVALVESLVAPILRQAIRPG